MLGGLISGHLLALRQPPGRSLPQESQGTEPRAGTEAEPQKGAAQRAGAGPEGQGERAEGVGKMGRVAGVQCAHGSVPREGGQHNLHWGAVGSRGLRGVPEVGATGDSENIEGCKSAGDGGRAAEADGWWSQEPRDWYNGELLVLADSLGQRLMPAFDTPTGIPYAWVNLKVSAAWGAFRPLLLRFLHTCCPRTGGTPHCCSALPGPVYGYV